MDFPRIGLGTRSADNATVKRHNLALVLDHIRRVGPSARSEIAEATGLTKGSITGLAAQLLDLGLIAEAGTRESKLGGRHLTLLRLDGSHFAILAVQIRVNEIVVQAANLSGDKIYSERHDHRLPKGAPDLLVDQVVAAMKRAASTLESQSVTLCRVGVIMAAPIRRDPVIIPLAVDFGWVMVDLIAMLRKRLESWADIPISLHNDASMAALAERDALAHEEGTAIENIVYLKSNTGIGGAAIVDGRLLRGVQGVAFEPGHTIVDGGRLPCACGQCGCLATVAGPEIVARAAGLGDMVRAKGLLPALDELVTRAKGQDSQAVAALTEAAQWIDQFISLIRMLFDPQLVLLGGYWADVFDTLSPSLERNFPAPAGIPPHWKPIRIEPARLGEIAAIEGFLDAAISKTLSDPTALE